MMFLVMLNDIDLNIDQNNDFGKNRSTNQPVKCSKLVGF